MENEASLDQYSRDESPSAIGTLPQSPELSKSLEGTQPAIRDAAHATEIIRGLFHNNAERVKEAARIRSKADGIAPPLDPEKLAEEGKSHKRNFSTGFLGTIIGRIIPRLVMRVKSTAYLTSSKFATDVENSALKTSVFRSAITDTIRGWPGWHFFLYELADNNVKFGKAFVAYDEKDQWRPSVYRIDDCAVPDGTKQGTLPDYFGIRREYSVSEAYDYIKEKEVAGEAGWNIDNMVKAINNAQPLKEDEEKETDEAAIDIHDTDLELIKPEAFTKDWRNVKFEILYAKEYSGKVSLMITDGETNEELFYQEDMYETMKEVVQAVCYDIGNASVYGSMGVGQMLYYMSVNIEKSRNQSQDQLAARVKFVLLVKDEAGLNDVQTNVTDEYIFITGADMTNGNNALPDNAEAFITTDRYLRGLAEEKVGAFTPDSMASDKTATQSQIDALKEAETRDAKLDYWLTYIGHVIAMMQVRIMDPLTTDPAAMIARARCLDVMNEAELQRLAHKPPAQTGIDWTDLELGKKVSFLMTKIGNPAGDQYWLERTIATLTIGKELTDEGLLPENDQTRAIEATRQQQDEAFTMSAQGVPVLVSPRDAHLVHMQNISGQQDEATGNWNGSLYGMLQEGNIKGATALLEHYNSHFTIAVDQEILGEYQNIAKSFMSDAAKAIEEAKQIAAGGVAPQQQNQVLA